MRPVETTLTQAQTRQKLKEAYDLHFAAVIERAEKQALLARHGRRLLNLLDDNPVVPGDVRPTFDEGPQARQILNDAEDDLREWQPRLEPIASSGGLQTNAMPLEGTGTGTSFAGQSEAPSEYTTSAGQGQAYPAAAAAEEQVHPAHRKGSSREASPSTRMVSGSTTGNGAPPYQSSEAESHSALV
jgi:hypothetical protein